MIGNTNSKCLGTGGMRTILNIETSPTAEVSFLGQTYIFGSEETEHSFDLGDFTGTIEINATLGSKESEYTMSVDVVGNYNVSIYFADFLTFTSIGSSSLYFKNVGGKNLEYSFNGGDWTTNLPTSYLSEIKFSDGDNVRLRGNNTTVQSDNGIFVMEGAFNASGNVNTLLDKTGVLIELTTEDCFTNLFAGCTSLVSAPELPATSLANSCYSYMFDGCTSLMTAPELPAVELKNKCYAGMFRDCTSLVIAPELPARTLSSECYSYMFDGCTSLVTAPELPATSIAGYCYNSMFQGCTSLVNVSELPATNLGGYGNDYCYRCMFQDCTSLVIAPELLATHLGTGSYYRMFKGCRSLNYVKAWFTSFGLNTTAWLADVSENGTFVCPDGLTISSRDANYVPVGWTIERI